MENKIIVEELLRLRKSGAKNKDLAVKLGCSPGFLSEVISGKKQAGKDLSDSLEQMLRAEMGILKDIAYGDPCRMVDIYNMVQAGDGATPEWHEPVDRRAIPTSYLKNGIRPVLVRGRSMEPTFKNGAIIGVNECDKQVVGGEAYAVLMPYEGAAVKRLYPIPDGVIIRSDNKEFPEVTLKRCDIPDFFILGRVCWVVQEV
jgi:SOS-response transcriptional repressor LexA